LKENKNKKLIKNVKIYVNNINFNTLKDLKTIFKKYNKVKNLIASQYSSINSLNILGDYKKEIRDVWTANGKLEEFSIPKRYVRLAIDDSIGNIKTNWVACFEKCKILISNNKNLSDEEKHYLRYLIKIKDLLCCVLTDKNVIIPEQFLNLNIKKLNSLIKRYVRKSLPSKSKYSKTSSIMIDETQYTVNKLNFSLSGLIKNHPYKLKLNTLSNLTGNIRLKLVNDTLVIYNSIDTKTYKNVNTNEIGVDKNYINVFDTNNGNSYGKDFNKLSNSYTDTLNAVNKKRQEYYVKIKELKEEISNSTDFSKIKKLEIKLNNIYKFNLGFIKYNRLKNKLQENLRKLINIAVKDLISYENPSLIVVENLDFQPKKNSKSNFKTTKKGRNKLSGFVKGVVQDRLEYISKKENIKNLKVNAAYTSQTCSKCGCQGNRTDDMFYCQNTNCVYHGGVSSGLNAGQNVFKRKDDKEISLKTKPYIVLSILNKRLVDNERVKSISEPNQPRPT